MRIPSLTLFCYALNEEELIESFLRKAARVIGQYTDDFEIIFHNDGSTDRTLELAQKVAREIPQLVIRDNERNRGVGYCAQESLRLATKECIFVNTVDEFWDFHQLEKFLVHFDDCDLLVAVRLQRRGCYTFWRQVISWTNYYLIKFLFGLKLRDVQNVHFYKKDFIQKIHVESRSSFISPEILIKATALRLKIKEVPMEYKPRQGGKAKGAKVKSLFHSFFEIMSFWFRWQILNKKDSFVQAYKSKTSAQPSVLQEAVR